MKRRLALTLILVLLVNGLLSVAVAAANPEIPPESGCPAGWPPLEVSWLESQGPYRAPRLVDNAGNGNGIICARALPDAFRVQFCGPACPVPIVYLFQDDDSPARR